MPLQYPWWWLWLTWLWLSPSWSSSLRHPTSDWKQNVSPRIPPLPPVTQPLAPLPLLQIALSRLAHLPRPATRSPNQGRCCGLGEEGGERGTLKRWFKTGMNVKDRMAWKEAGCDCGCIVYTHWWSFLLIFIFYLLAYPEDKTIRWWAEIVKE